jgi:hypothetical protein
VIRGGEGLLKECIILSKISQAYSKLKRKQGSRAEHKWLKGKRAKLLKKEISNQYVPISHHHVFAKKK